MADVNERSDISQNGNAVIGSAAIRPVFLGNLKPEYSTAKVEELFAAPINPPNCTATFKPIAVDRIDIKRGFCFVFLKDAASQEEKDQIEAFVAAIQGMYVTTRELLQFPP
jgi:arginine/serine-rich splicing factor 4/5/6